MLTALLDTIYAKGGTAGSGGGPTASPISVQREFATWSAADNTFTISSVDTSKSLCRWVAALPSPTNEDGDATMDNITSILSFSSATAVLADGQSAGATGRSGALEVWELPQGAAFGIEKRYDAEVSWNTSDLTQDIDLSSAGITAIGDCAAIVTSVFGSDDDNSPAGGCFMTEVDLLDDSGFKARLTRKNNTYAVKIRLVVLEFTGSNWSVQKVSHTIVAGNTEETETISAVDWAHTFILPTWNAVDSNQDAVLVASYNKTATSVAFKTGTAGIGNEIIAYVIEDTSGTIVVEHQNIAPMGGSTESITWTNTYDSGLSIFLVTAMRANAGAAWERTCVHYDHDLEQLYRPTAATDPDVWITAVEFPATGS